MIDIKPEKYEEFKEFMAKKLSRETGRKFLASDIYVSDSEKDLYFDTSKHYKCIFGNINFAKYNKKVLQDIEFIWGDAKFESLKIDDLGELRFISGKAIFNDMQLQPFNKLEYVGDLLLSNVIIKSLGSLKEIKGNLLIKQSLIDNFGMLKKIEKSVFINDNNVIPSLNNIEYIGGDLILCDFITYKGCIIHSIGNLGYVGGRCILNSSQMKVFGDKIKKSESIFKHTFKFKNDPNFQLDNTIDEKQVNELI